MKGKGLGVKALEILNLSDPGIFSAITMANSTIWDLFGSCIVYVRFCLSRCESPCRKIGWGGAGRGTSRGGVWTHEIGAHAVAQMPSTFQVATIYGQKLAGQSARNNFSQKTYKSACLPLTTLPKKIEMNVLEL